MTDETVTIKFRPLEPKTLVLLYAQHQAEGEDPAQTYSRLISAAVLAGAMLSITPKDMADHAVKFGEAAVRCVSERKDIFGDREE